MIACDLLDHRVNDRMDFNFNVENNSITRYNPCSEYNA